MAEAVLEIVLNKLSSLLQNELALFQDFEQDFNSLSSLLTTIKATLEDAEEKQFTDKAIKDWLLKLKDAAHVLDDIFDECATQALMLEYKRSKSVSSYKVLSSLHPKHVAFRYKIAKQMKHIRERLDEIAEERTKFHLTEIVRERRTGVLDWRQTTSIISQPQVYGRDEDKDKIVDFLVDNASGLEDLPVYPIVGLGGIGKTTLAQLVFNHEKVVNHFKPRMWVCVSEDFSLKRMTKAIIEAATKKSCDDLDLEPLQRNLQDLLQGKRFLLVLDDVWDNKQENWQRLRSVIACGAKGSSIMVTTRLAKVAEIMGTMPPHDISKLSDQDCWDLFKQRAFGTNEEEPAKLVVIGKEIVKKCGGVPLAAIALGSLMHFKREEKEWLYVKESKLWNLEDEDSVMPALRLSYLNLPIKLRQCFSFCAIFDKDERISKKILIELWMANGFISSNEMLDEEDIGNEVWNELYWRSFFQDVEIDGLGKIKKFKMHDLVHDLAQSISDEVCCIGDNDEMSITSERIPHLSFRHLSIRRFKTIGWPRGVKSLRTCIMLGICGEELLPHVFKFYNSLRVLKLGFIDLVPSSIGHLKNLWYLALSSFSLKTLPDSICNLWNLQILKLDHCYNLQSLPNNLIRLKALKCLSLDMCLALSNLPPHIGKLTLLKTLSMYVVGKKKGCFLAELGQLNLKGKIHIKHLERVKTVEDAKEANMSSKYINCLELSWEITEESQLQENVEQILEALQPQVHQLQKLSVEGYSGAHFPQWMSSTSLKHLKSLTHEDWKSCLHLPQLAKLPSLKKLFISNVSLVIYVDNDSYDGGIGGGFIALECLELKKLPNLISLSRDDRVNVFPHLSTLHISDCPKLSGLPCLTSLKKFTVSGLSLSCLDLLTNEVLQGLHSHEISSSKKSFNLSGSFQRLEELVIKDLPQIEGLHETLQHLSSLHSLILEDLPNLSSLPDWLGNLSMLYELKIIYCPKLRCLPMSIQSLTNLKYLAIWGCSPELKKRCEKETGEDWQKIAHVQSIYMPDPFA